MAAEEVVEEAVEVRPSQNNSGLRQSVNELARRVHWCVRNCPHSHFAGLWRWSFYLDDGQVFGGSVYQSSLGATWAARSSLQACGVLSEGQEIPDDRLLLRKH